MNTGISKGKAETGRYKRVTMNGDLIQVRNTVTGAGRESSLCRQFSDPTCSPASSSCFLSWVVGLLCLGDEPAARCLRRDWRRSY